MLPIKVNRARAPGCLGGGSLVAHPWVLLTVAYWCALPLVILRLSLILDLNIIVIWHHIAVLRSHGILATKVDSIYRASITFWQKLEVNGCQLGQSSAAVSTMPINESYIHYIRRRIPFSSLTNRDRWMG